MVVDVLLPELWLANVFDEVVVEELPLHDMSISASMKTKRIEIERDLECCNTTPFFI